MHTSKVNNSNSICTFPEIQREIHHRSRVRQTPFNPMYVGVPQSHVYHNNDYRSRPALAVGTAVCSTRYGVGTVLSTEHGYMKVDFANKICSFLYPETIDKGFLRTVENR